MPRPQDTVLKDKVVKDTLIRDSIYTIYQGKNGGKYIYVTSKAGNVYKRYLKDKGTKVVYIYKYREVNP